MPDPTNNTNGSTTQGIGGPKESPSRRFPKLRGWFSKVGSCFSKVGRWFLKVPGFLSVLNTRCIEYFFKGATAESEKTVVSASWFAALGKCLIHVPPMAATIALTYFNLAGYFIGSNLEGLTPPSAQAIDRLCLQVTAKLIVRYRFF